MRCSIIVRKITGEIILHAAITDHAKEMIEQWVYDASAFDHWATAGADAQCGAAFIPAAGFCQGGK